MALFKYIIGVILYWSPFAVAEQEMADLVGEARDLRSGELLYVESHFYDNDGRNHRVIYEAPNGEILARKQLDYSRSFMQPAVKQSNQLCGEELEVAHEEDGESIALRYRDKAGARVQTASLSAKQLVIDAGFDAYVQEQWSALQQGRKIDFDYLVPSRLASYSFALQATDCPAAEEGINCMSIEPSSWWMRVLVDPITLSYDAASRRLLGFRGLGNIADASCDYLQVDIDYSYAKQM